MKEFPFLNGSFDGRSASFDAQRTVNFYLEQSESQSSRSAAMLIGTPGLLLWTNLTGGNVRGEIVFDSGTSIVVVGDTVWKVLTDKTATNIGNVVDEGPVVSMASNGQVIMMVGGQYGYFINPTTNTVTQIDDPDFEGSTNVYFVDGFFVFNKLNTGQFQITQLYGEDIDGLDFATAEGAPDPIVSLIVDHREVWLLGVDSTEVWINTGSADFPFQRIQGAFLEIGCAAAQSVAKMDNSFYWLAFDERGYGTVQRAQGYSNVRVSNHAVEYAIGNYSRIDDAVAYTYTQEGRSFYVLSFPTADRTWCLDPSNGLWHERAYYNADGSEGRHRSNCQMNFAGLTLVGDWENGNVYSMDLDTYSDNGNPIVALRRCPHITNNTDYEFFQVLELTMQTGVGLPSGQGSDPQAMLRWSDDGGYSWSNQRTASIGKIGERKARVRWNRLGKSRDRVFEVSISDPVKRIITDSALRVVGGRV